jgi:hypothetical protein
MKNLTVFHVFKKNWATEQLSNSKCPLHLQTLIKRELSKHFSLSLAQRYQRGTLSQYQSPLLYLFISMVAKGKRRSLPFSRRKLLFFALAYPVFILRLIQTAYKAVFFFRFTDVSLPSSAPLRLLITRRSALCMGIKVDRNLSFYFSGV